MPPSKANVASSSAGGSQVPGSTESASQVRQGLYPGNFSETATLGGHLLRFDPQWSASVGDDVVALVGRAGREGWQVTFRFRRGVAARDAIRQMQDRIVALPDLEEAEGDRGFMSDPDDPISHFQWKAASSPMASDAWVARASDGVFEVTMSPILPGSLPGDVPWEVRTMLNLVDTSRS